MHLALLRSLWTLKTSKYFTDSTVIKMIKWITDELEKFSCAMVDHAA